MKPKCRNIDITDVDTIYPWVWDCCMRHKRRNDFRVLFLRHGMSAGDYWRAIHRNDKQAFEGTVYRICADAADRIQKKQLFLPIIRIRIKMDITTGKIRQIGFESAMQQVFDYIAVFSCMDEILKKRIVTEQVSSIEGRGQMQGMQMIRSWIRKDNDCLRYATMHGKHYVRKCRYFVKLDIRKCYSTANKEIFMNYFRRDCGNKDIVWLWDTLFSSHIIDGYSGFMIGALPSQWACQYLLSFVYRFAKSIHSTRRKKQIKSVSHMLLFMDDMLLTGTNRKKLLDATKQVIAFTKDNLGWEIKESFHIRDLDNFHIDMMGFVIRADGSCIIRGRTFVKARRLFIRYQHDHMMALKSARRLASYKGYFLDRNDNLVTDSFLVAKRYDINECFAYASFVTSKHDKAVYQRRKVYELQYCCC